MYITFTEGYYNIKGQPTNVGGLTFKMVEDYKVAKDGTGYVTVEGGSNPASQIVQSASVVSRVLTMLRAVPNPFHKEFLC